MFATFAAFATIAAFATFAISTSISPFLFASMFFYLGLAQVLLVFLPAVQCTIDIDDYFNVKTGNEDVGGCDQTYTTAGVSKSGHEWLQTWFVEAQSLTDAALSAINSYGTEQSSRDNLLVFMGVKPDKAGKAPAIQNRLDEIKGLPSHTKHQSA